jgi:YD repeat-containing protein
VTNTYDLADELTTSLNKVGSSQPLTTTYTYDGNGNQVIASGPTSATVNTYNQQNQLVQVQGPNTDLQLVYDGQGDRLRSYEQLVPTPVIVNDVQDLVSAGTQD